MKNSYNIKSDRYNHVHKFVRILNTEYYRFVPEEDWMPLYLTYASDKNEVAFVDTEGGPCIDTDWSNNEIRVTEIKLINDILMFKLEEL
jgi:hypothetical protein